MMRWLNTYYLLVLKMMAVTQLKMYASRLNA
jgi:hypothetical protein